MKTYVTNSWNATTSCIQSSWNWYSHLPLWQQVAIVGGTAIIVGGGLYLFLNGKGDVSPSSSSGENVVSSNFPTNLDIGSNIQAKISLNKADSLLEVKSRISEILSPYISSPAQVEHYANAYAPQLVDFGPDRITIHILEALGRGKSIPSGISLNNVFPQMFQTPECFRPASIFASDLTTFGIKIVQQFFNVGTHVDASSLSSPQSWAYLENLCAKPLYFFLQNPSAVTNLDLTRLKAVCEAVNLSLSNPTYTSSIMSQDALLYSWSIYYPYLVSIPLSMVT